MKFVEPIIDTSKVNVIKDLMMEDGKKELALLFYFGCYHGLRIGDILKLTFEDLRNEEFRVIEQKTGKERIIFMPEKVKMLFSEIDSPEKSGLIFVSKSNRNRGAAWSTVYTGNEIKDYCELAGLHGRYNNHTLRKTFAYTLYQNSNHDLVLVQQALNHSKVETTRRYLGTYATETQKAIRNLDF